MSNPLNATVSYFQGVVTEMRKVVWPKFPVVMRYFFSVVFGVAVGTAFIWAVDYVFIKALGYVIK